MDFLQDITKTGLLFKKDDVEYYTLFGEMVEWFKAAVLKTAVGSPHREFESRSLRQFFAHSGKLSR